MRREKYYISGRAYFPEDDTLLCEVKPGSFNLYEEQLYMTARGAFYVIRSFPEQDDCDEIKLLTDAEASRFMEQHAAGIITDNYDNVFGVPERG